MAGRWVLAVGAALALAACGGSGSGTPDAAMDTGGGEGGVTSCDPAVQDCAGGMKCDFDCDGTTAVLACQPSTAGGGVGTPCSAGMPCARGTGCLTTPDAGAACRKYCAGDGDCATAERCHNVTVTFACGGSSPPILLHYCY